MTTATHTKPKRRFLRFSVRTLLIVLTIFCVALGWKVERARKQREAVAWVDEMGGSVSYDYEVDGVLKPPGPKWLRNLLGIDYFDDVVGVGFGTTQVSDVTPLSGLTSLRALDLHSTQVSDITPLSGLTSLQALDLHGTQVSEEAVEQLKRALPECTMVP